MFSISMLHLHCLLELGFLSGRFMDRMSRNQETQNNSLMDILLSKGLRFMYFKTLSFLLKDADFILFKAG